MGRGVAFVALALLIALPADAAKPRLHATTARNGTVLIGGKPQFLIGLGWPTPAKIPRALSLGIDLLQSNGPGATQRAISQAVGSRGFVLPDFALKHVQAHYQNAIGYSLPDEPDGNGLLPATADPDRGPRLPYTERSQKTGVLITQTITAHFMAGQPKLHGITDADYRGYIENADVVLTAVYPFAHGCVDAGLSLSMVYDAIIELKKLAPARAVGEWIETGPIEGYCGLDSVTPAQARAEAWASIAAGAQTLFWFTHSFGKGFWDDFDVSPDMAAVIASTNAEVDKHATIALGWRDPNALSAPGDAVKIGLRSVRGRYYLIAANLSPVDADLGAASWWPRVPGLSSQGVDELLTGWTGTAGSGRFTDVIPPWGVRIYTWVPQKPISGAGL